MSFAIGQVVQICAKGKHFDQIGRIVERLHTTESAVPVTTYRVIFSDDSEDIFLSNDLTDLTFLGGLTGDGTVHPNETTGAKIAAVVSTLDETVKNGLRALRIARAQSEKQLQMLETLIDNFRLKISILNSQISTRTRLLELLEDCIEEAHNSDLWNNTGLRSQMHEAIKIWQDYRAKENDYRAKENEDA